MEASSAARQLMALYRAYGDHRYGEDITQLQHALQCLACAERAGEAEAVVVASFLHDVGHLVAARGGELVDELGSRDHETVGRSYLTTLGMPEDVVAMVATHVEAKRYLCAVEPGYAATLSSASLQTLRRQGGPLSDVEITAFRRTPTWQASVRLRRYDDHGKDPSLELAGLDAVEARLARFLLSL